MNRQVFSLSSYIYILIFIISVVVGYNIKSYSCNLKENPNNMNINSNSNYINVEQDYNYYLLSIQRWCGNDWQIHGFWPQYNNASYPSYCSKVDYHEPQDKLLDNMHKYWNNCDESKTNSLWEHEWSKHGSCVYQQFNTTEEEYFETAINLFEEWYYVIPNTCQEGSQNCILGCFDLKLNKIEC